jgi:excisionase family DNA binding protein
MANTNESLEAMITRIVFDAVNSALKVNQLAQIAVSKDNQETPVGVAEAAMITNLSKQTIYKLVCQGKIPYKKSKNRGKLYFFKSELMNWLIENPEEEVSSLEEAVYA